MNNNYFQQIDKDNAAEMMSVFRPAIDAYRLGLTPDWDALTMTCFGKMISTSNPSDAPAFARHEAWKAAYATMVQRSNFDRLLHGMFWCEATFPAFGAAQEALRNGYGEKEAQMVAWQFFLKHNSKRAA